MTMMEQRSDIELTKDTPLLPIMVELWGVCYEDGRNITVF